MLDMDACFPCSMSSACGLVVSLSSSLSSSPISMPSYSPAFAKISKSRSIGSSGTVSLKCSLGGAQEGEIERVGGFALLTEGSFSLGFRFFFFSSLLRLSIFVCFLLFSAEDPIGLNPMGLNFPRCFPSSSNRTSSEILGAEQSELDLPALCSFNSLMMSSLVRFFGGACSWYEEDDCRKAWSRASTSSAEMVAFALFCSSKAKSRPLTRMECSLSPPRYFRWASTFRHAQTKMPKLKIKSHTLVLSSLSAFRFSKSSRRAST